MSSQMPEFKLEVNDLYTEETFTDRRVGSIRRLQPVTADGQPDAARPVLFVGQTQILTPMGALPLNFEIPAATLREAREQASSIVVPEAGMGGLGGVGGRPGGRIQLR